MRREAARLLKLARKVERELGRLGLTLDDAQKARRELERKIIFLCREPSIERVTSETVIDAGCTFDWIVYNALDSMISAHDRLKNASVWMSGVSKRDFVFEGE